MLIKIQEGGLMEILILIMIIAFFGIIVIPFASASLKNSTRWLCSASTFRKSVTAPIRL